MCHGRATRYSTPWHPLRQHGRCGHHSDSNSITTQKDTCHYPCDYSPRSRKSRSSHHPGGTRKWIGWCWISPSRLRNITFFPRSRCPLCTVFGQRWTYGRWDVWQHRLCTYSGIQYRTHWNCPWCLFRIIRIQCDGGSREHHYQNAAKTGWGECLLALWHAIPGQPQRNSWRLQYRIRHQNLPQ